MSSVLIFHVTLFHVSFRLILFLRQKIYGISCTERKLEQVILFIMFKERGPRSLDLTSLIQNILTSLIKNYTTSLHELYAPLSSTMLCTKFQQKVSRKDNCFLHSDSRQVNKSACNELFKTFREQNNLPRTQLYITNSKTQ